MNELGNSVENKTEPLALAEADVIDMVKETSLLCAEKNINALTAMESAYRNSSALASKVEFWRWLDKNYTKSGIFTSSRATQNYIQGSAEKTDWLLKNVQGKGYEWDWVQAQRANFKNLFKRYELGNIPTQPASDVTEINMLTGTHVDYQMKAYTSSSSPKLANTPKDMTVVTNAEKTGVVRTKGYENVQEFKDASTIKSDTASRMQQIREGKSLPHYTIGNVATTAAKAGLIGCAIGITVETVASFKDWKEGRLSNSDYLKEILKAGADSGLTSAATSVIMIPISAMVTTFGLAQPLLIPIGFVLGVAINKIIAPCFGRGDYKKFLQQAIYYTSLDLVYRDLTASMEKSAQEFTMFISEMNKMQDYHESCQQESRLISIALSDLYSSI